jgi:phospholipase/carboxylesterase
MTPQRHPADALGWRIGPTSGDSLLLLLHGVGASAQDLVPVAQALCATNARRVCVLLDGPAPFDGGGSGRQWFSVAGVTPQNRAERVAPALPLLAARIAALAAAEGLTTRDVTLLGFSQGAILTLGLAAAGYSFGHGVALAGRLAGPVQPATSASPRLWLSHGVADPVIPISESISAEQRLAAAGFDTVFLPIEGLGHTIALEQIQAADRWLSPEFT